VPEVIDSAHHDEHGEREDQRVDRDGDELTVAQHHNTGGLTCFTERRAFGEVAFEDQVQVCEVDLAGQTRPRNDELIYEGL
jgi:hypothetical protein